MSVEGAQMLLIYVICRCDGGKRILCILNNAKSRLDVFIAKPFRE
jgi:hypothetical protein